jgi:hypothetical protein
MKVRTVFIDRWFINLFNSIRSIKLRLYKRRKIKEAKTREDRIYYLKFKIRVDDSVNPQESLIEYNMIVPAKAVFFAKRKVLKSIKEKISVDVSWVEELSESELVEFEQSRDEFILEKKRSNV